SGGLRLRQSGVRGCGRGVWARQSDLGARRPGTCGVPVLLGTRLLEPLAKPSRAARRGNEGTRAVARDTQPACVYRLLQRPLLFRQRDTLVFYWFGMGLFFSLRHI